MAVMTKKCYHSNTSKILLSDFYSRNEQELDMVRHECAEALGSIATDKVYEELSKYLNKSQPEVLRESCVVALDFADYNNASEFQYADTLSKV